MVLPKILIVDDDEMVRLTLAEVLLGQDFDVSVAGNVAEAMRLINSETFDVLLSDLHMPGAGDGLTVVSIMRHTHPKAVTILLSAFPEMDAAAHAILRQTDQVLMKPIDFTALVKVIRQRLANGAPPMPIVESTAAVLERSAAEIIQDWYTHVQTEPLLMLVRMTEEERCCHLPQMFLDIISRLGISRDLGTKQLISVASAEYGECRRKQGYSAAMLVEESRQLQISIFRALQKSLDTIDFSVVLTDVMVIADEVDSQLSQAMQAYIAESVLDRPVLHSQEPNLAPQ